uniref:Uncharacterized protein n=1 Tax=Oryza sativa subsp. japonica TaxID=39947 RepID=Q2QQC7_ORYSJ|nr:hypothetical protein LOC_Os12g31499 [Oryza sativa Japonica Group]
MGTLKPNSTPWEHNPDGQMVIIYRINMKKLHDNIQDRQLYEN